MSWEGTSDWDEKEILKGSSVLVVLKDGPNHGRLLRSVGYTDAVPAAGTWEMQVGRVPAQPTTQADARATCPRGARPCTRPRSRARARAPHSKNVERPAAALDARAAPRRRRRRRTACLCSPPTTKSLPPRSASGACRARHGPGRAGSANIRACLQIGCVRSVPEAFPPSIPGRIGGGRQGVLSHRVPEPLAVSRAGAAAAAAARFGTPDMRMRVSIIKTQVAAARARRRAPGRERRVGPPWWQRGARAGAKWGPRESGPGLRREGVIRDAYVDVMCTGT